MSLKSSLVARFLSIVMAITTSGAGANAQGAPLNRVLSCVENEVNHSLILQTASSRPMSAPKIQYLPGEDGKTVMVADFYGLSWIEASKIIRLAPNDASAFVEEVRIGQFQANPPICRVALVTTNPACLKEVSFSSKPGLLVIKWEPPVIRRSKAGGQKSRTTMPAPALGTLTGTEGHQVHTTLIAAAPAAVAGTGPQQMRMMPPPAPAIVAQWQTAKVARRKPDAQVPPAEIRTLPTLPPDAVQTDDERVDDLLSAARRSTIKSAPARVTAAPRAITATSPAVTPTPTNVTATPTRITASPSRITPTPAKVTATPADQMPPPAPDVVARSQSSSSEADVLSNADAGEKETDDDAAPGPPMGRLTIINGKNANDPKATIQILTEKHITFKSFRLHNPERHVIDLEKSEDFDEATVSGFESNPFLKTVRIGVPDKKTCRIVLDLADENVGVSERSYAGDDRLLTITLTEQAPQTQADRSITGSSAGSSTVVLDAGHGGTDPGAQRGDTQEKEMTLAIVKQLQKRLEASGLHVIMTRADDTFVSLEDRVKLTNNVMPSAFVSVHINALESTSDIHGIETYFQTEQSKPLAEIIHSNLVNLLGVPDRGIRKARFYVINHTPVPAILAEVGFISNKAEREKLISSDYQGKVADALAQGVMLYLGKGSSTQTTATRSAFAVSDRKPAKKGTTSKAHKSIASRAHKSVASSISRSSARQVSR